MTRREIIKYTAYITGAAVGAPFMATFMSGCRPESGMVETGELFFFDDKGFAQMKALVDAILPGTDSPAASAVGVHHTIDHMVGNVYDSNAQKVFKDKFAALKEYLVTNGGNGWESQSSNIITELLSGLEKSTASGDEKVKRAFLDLKQQTVAYYLSTGEVATKFLNYLPIPGSYESCIPLSDVGGKAWAL